MVPSTNFSARYIPTHETLALILEERGLTHEWLASATNIPVEALRAPLTLEDAAVAADVLDFELPALVKRTMDRSVQFLCADDLTPLRPHEATAVDLVQIGDGAPGAIVDLTDVDFDLVRRALSSDTSDTYRSTQERLTASVRDWTNVEISGRLNAHPGVARFLRVGHLWGVVDVIKLANYLRVSPSWLFAGKEA
jgi:hypothetical protein